MAQQKLTAEQVRRIEEIEEFKRAADHLMHLVKELESNRAGQTRTIQQLSEKIVNASSQMRQRALTANIGTIADVAGTMSVMASRGGGINMKIRALADAIGSLHMQLEAAMRHAMEPPEPDKNKPKNG
jgi:chromosome segregation ATPase